MGGTFCYNNLRFHKLYAYVLGHGIASSLKYKYIVLRRDKSVSPKTFSETDITMLEVLIDNIFVMFDESIFQQTVGIHMGSNCAPLLYDFLLARQTTLIASIPITIYGQ